MAQIDTIGQTQGNCGSNWGGPYGKRYEYITILIFITIHVNVVF